MTTNEMLKTIWDKGYELKVTSTEIRVFKTEFCEYLDLDTYNSIVVEQHKGNVTESIDSVLKRSLAIIGA